MTHLHEETKSIVGFALLLLATAAGCAPPGEAGQEVEGQSGAIIGAANMSNADAARSGVVLIHVNGDNTCTGTLLDRRWVLSAAHCFGAPANALVDTDGDNRIDDSSGVRVAFGNLADPARVLVGVTDVLKPASSTWGSASTTDLALLRLDADAPSFAPLVANHFTNGRIELYGGADASLVGKTVRLFGYGKNEGVYGQGPWTSVGTLRTSELKVTKVANGYIEFTSSTPAGGTCNGDSGGPGFYDLKNADGSVKARFFAGVISQGSCVGWSAISGAQGLRQWVSERVWGRVSGVKVLAAGGLTGAANLIDGDVGTKATKAAAQAAVDLDLGATYQLTEVRVGEDNAGTQNVKEYDVQCWTGSAWAPPLFRDTDTPFAVPQLDEHFIANGCTTSRVRVNLYNAGGGIEAFEVELYGRAAGSRKLTVATSPAGCTTGDLAPGTYDMPAGSYPSTCAQDCAGYVFGGWSASEGLYTTDRGQSCIYVMDLQRAGTLTARFVPPYVWITPRAGAHGRVTPGGPFQAAYGSNVTITATPDANYQVKGYTYPSTQPESPFSGSQITVKALHDSTLDVAFQPIQVYVTSQTDGHGTVSPEGYFHVDAGSTVAFSLTPAAGYRMKEICDEDNACLPWTQNTYSLVNVQHPDKVLVFNFEPAGATDVQAAATLLGSSFATAANLIDGNLTTKALDSTTASHEAYVDLKLDRRYTLTRLQVFEDGGAWQVDAYGLQCWTGTAWAAPLFRDTNATKVLPAPNEHLIPGTQTCTTDRVRVNLHHTGSVEAFEVKVFGK